MSGRPRKGRPVAFAPITPERSQPDPVLGLKFTIEARHGGTVLVDMTGLDPRPLAIAFAGALRRSAALGGPIGAASVIKQYVQVYRHFFAWLGDDAPEVTGVNDLRAVHIDGFASALERRGMGAIHRHITVGKVINTLRAIEADRPDRIAPDLHERLRYTLATSAGRSTPRDAYSPFVARALRDAARADIEAMLRRLGADDRTDEGDPVVARARADVEAIIARQGFIVADQPALKRLYFMRMRRGLPISTLIDDLHGRHHLLARDLPALLVLLTSFTRIAIVLSLTRNALGLQGVPPNQVIVGLALFLSFFVMSPVLSQINQDALQPMLDGEIEQGEAYDRAVVPLRAFMLEQVGDDELELFVAQATDERPEGPDDVPMAALVPAFVLSELKTAFLIGFVVFIPFLVIDLIVSSSLMSMGMMMLPPVLVSLPFKILLFVLVDGWGLIVKSLLESF